MSKQIAIHCAQCGHANRLGSLFCAACRARLDLAAESPGLAPPPSLRRKIWPALLLGALLLATGLGVLVFWPMRPAGMAGAPAARQSFQRKIQILRDGAGPARQIFTAAEINAGLATALTRFPAPPSIWTPRLSAVGVAVKPSALIVEYSSQLGPFPVRDLRLGPFELSGCLIYAYHPDTGLRLHRAWLGHCYLPGPLARLAAWPVRPFGMAAAAAILTPGRVLELGLEDGKVVAQTK